MSAIARWRHRRLLRRMAGPRLIAAFAQAHRAPTFVEIGANDGVQHDFLREHVLRDGWRGLMVEPVPYVFERLERNYAGVDGVGLVQAAVGARDGTATFFHLRDAPDAERAALPPWYDGIGSFSRDAVLSHAPQLPDVAERIVEREVRVVTFETLVAEHGIAAVDLVVVDTEGHDWEVLRSIDLARHRPRLIVYEHFHLDPGARSAARAHLEHAGYATMEEGFDTFALRPGDPPDALDRAWGRLKPVVPGVAKRDEQLPLADRSVPLPPGAAEALRADHPRLEELRAAYAALDLPVSARSRWSTDRVDAFLDLAWFRGESLIMWHYRDDEEATRRRYAELLDHVRAHDDLGLLGRLREDGAFGCWTFDVDGLRVSRDLLDSVAELNFLARRRPVAGLRVLDVGAGYGRLAHRAVEGLGDVADWCCIDAIPESTFVCEHYLGFRGVAPPARALPLHRHSELVPGAFDLAVNVHSFSEMPIDAIGWWVDRLAALEIPALFLVPNEAELLSLEPGGERRPFGPLLERAGFALRAEEQAHTDVHRLYVRA